MRRFAYLICFITVILKALGTLPALSWGMILVPIGILLIWDYLFLKALTDKFTFDELLKLTDPSLKVHSILSQYKNGTIDREEAYKLIKTEISSEPEEQKPKIKGVGYDNSNQYRKKIFNKQVYKSTRGKK